MRRQWDEKGVDEKGMGGIGSGMGRELDGKGVG